MHVAFMVYGHNQRVEETLRDMTAQKFPFRLTKDKKVKWMWVEGSLRRMPGGIYEYVFPKEWLVNVLYSMKAHENPRESYVNQTVKFMGMTIKPLKYLQKFFHLEPVPDIKDGQFMVYQYEDGKVNKMELRWMTDNVTIIPLGIREDRMAVNGEGMPNEGWTQEML